MPEQAVQLDYGQRSKVRRRRTVVGLLLMAAVAGALWTAWHIGEPAWQRYRARAKVARWLKQCLNDSPGKDVVAYEGDPDRAALLMNRPGYATIDPRLPHPGRRYLIAACRVPTQWYYLAIPFSSGWSRGRPFLSDPVLFLHARQTTTARKRLVVVQSQLYFRGPPFATEAALCAVTFDPDVPFGSRPVETSRWIGPTVTALWGKEGEWLRIFAGQPDPGDPSHFTIEYEADGKHGVIDGWLRESQTHTNADEVVLKVR
jgi:hypothetical protein